tara:strand:- start:105234 stop:106307 length:1074 start_codon:yes stop_codon:yes gene_type:complete
MRRDVSKYYKKWMILKLGLVVLKHLTTLSIKRGIKFKALFALKEDIAQRRSVLYPIKLKKVDGRVYWNLNIPGYPAKRLPSVIKNEINSILSLKTGTVNTLIFALTKKCGLNCAHCFEWNEINKKEALSDSDVQLILRKYITDASPSQVLLSGGEPFNRYNLMLQLIAEHSQKGVDFWIISSGKGATLERLVHLKKQGLIGLIISIDHYLPAFHNQFRGSYRSFAEALEAIRLARQLNLVTTVSVCPQKGKVTEEFVQKYLEFAKSLRVQFVQIIEPRNKGRYDKKDMELTTEDQQVLESVYQLYNSDSSYDDFPIIQYPDFNRRRFGCLGGISLAYLDTNGKLNACPFCEGIECCE